MTRDDKVNAAFTAMAAGATIVTVLSPLSLPFMAARVLGIGASNLLGAEVTKNALSFFDRWGYKVEKNINVTTSEAPATV